MTLRYWGQLLDIVPMMLGSLMVTYNYYMVDSKPNVSYWKTNVLFVAWGLFTSLAMIFSRIHLIFMVCFSGQTAIMMLKIMYLKKQKCTSTLSSYLITMCLTSYFCGLSLWLFEQKYCRYTQPLHLHSIWHLFAGFGCHYSIYVSVILRAQFLKQHCALKMVKMCGAIPVSHYLIYVDDKVE